MDKLMTGKILGTFFLAIFFAGNCAAESGDSPVVTDWGKSVCEIQISISLNTNVITAGSTEILRTWIKNSSTNAIRFNPNQSKPYILINTSGKIYTVMPIINYDLNIPNITVEPGQIREWSWPVIFRKDIEPSNYVFNKITRNFTGMADNKVCTITSNSLDVKVVK